MLEADFQRTYRLDLRAEVAAAEAGDAARCTYRRLVALIRGLPPDAAIHRMREEAPEARRPKRHATPEEIARMFGEFN